MRNVFPPANRRLLRWPELFLLFAGAIAHAQGVAKIDAELEVIRARHQLPALAAVAVQDDEVLFQGAVGVRKLGSSERVTVNDKWHIGSCTKSMTATLAAMLVEQGKLRWDTKIGDLFPELRETMDPSWQTVTLEMLLTHRAGAPAEPPPNLWRNARSQTGAPRQQRLDFVSGLLLRSTEEPPGTKFVYSNQGYAIAGAMLERVTGKPWEDLIRSMIFGPCRMTSAGFGAPAAVGRMDQPWGHEGEEMKPVPPGPKADNPPAVGPAGTVHCSLADLAHYAALHALGEKHGTLFLKREGFVKLHTPPAGQEYALGWVSTPRSWAGGQTLNHNGSNTTFFVTIWIAPAKGAVFVAATNAAGKAAAQATDEAIGVMIEKLLK